MVLSVCEEINQFQVGGKKKKPIIAGVIPSVGMPNR
jgi:hypothetical protein